MSSITANKSDPRSCPCQRVPLTLSSATAAEYGDIHRLAVLAARSGKANQLDAIVLAAQNGHVEATRFLLRQATCTSTTPLHRASFSGAVETIAVLLSEASCDLFAPDETFGDMQTPLHKAAAGGRPRAVLLLLQALQEKGALQSGLNLRDAQGQTALQVTRANLQLSRDGLVDVSRWDEVAGGPADWEACIRILEDPISYIEASRGDVTTASASSNTRSVQYDATPVCFDCCAMDTRQRVTSSWEAAFSRAMQVSARNNQQMNVGDTAHESTNTPSTLTSTNQSTQDANGTTSQSSAEYVQAAATAATMAASPSSQQAASKATATTGIASARSRAPARVCHACNSPGFLFYRNNAGELVCKTCRCR
jgi:Ankyrin repeats (3 copies)